MEDKPYKIFYPAGIPELFSQWSLYPGGVLYAGGTSFLRNQAGKMPELPPVILSLEGIGDLKKISRTERYIEIGSMVTLGRILDLGKIVPDILKHCIENISSLHVRNMATIGGNICLPAMDCSAALTALDASYEFRNAQSSRWVQASRFALMSEMPHINNQELLSRIRIPLDTWDFSAYHKFAWQGNRSRTAIFMAKTQKNLLSDIRIIYKTAAILRDKVSESILIGKGLPLNRRIINEFIGHWDAFICAKENVDELSRKEFENFIEVNISKLSE